MLSRSTEAVHCINHDILCMKSARNKISHKYVWRDKFGNKPAKAHVRTNDIKRHTLSQYPTRTWK